MQNKQPKPKPSTEYLSKDILDEEFIQLFSTLLWFQKILGVSRVDAKDRFVTAPTAHQKLYTIFVSGISLLLFSITHYLYFHLKFDYEEMKDIAIFVYLTISGHYMCNMLYARFANNKANAKFHIKMQQFDRFMGVNNNKAIHDFSRRINNWQVLSMIIGLFNMILISSFGGWHTVIGFIATMWFAACSIFELFYCYNLLMYFLIRMRYINCILLNHVEGRNVSRKPFVMWYPTRNVIRYLVPPKHDYINNETDACLRKLFECFLNFQDLYRFPIALHIFSLITLCLTAVKAASIEFINNKFDNWEQILIFGFLIGALWQTLAYVSRFEMFFQEVKYTRRMALAIMSRDITGPLRDKAKRIVNLIDQLPPKFSVYDMWNMNAKFLLNFVNVVAYLVITLLQFVLPKL